jgi:hypothetical protein
VEFDQFVLVVNLAVDCLNESCHQNDFIVSSLVPDYVFVLYVTIGCKPAIDEIDVEKTLQSKTVCVCEPNDTSETGKAVFLLSHTCKRFMV